MEGEARHVPSNCRRHSNCQDLKLNLVARHAILSVQMATPTLRTLARTLGLSRTTISDACAAPQRVNAQTAERVRAAAKAAGYESNPLTGTVMSLLRRSRSQEFRGVLQRSRFPTDLNHRMRFATMKASLPALPERAHSARLQRSIALKSARPAYASTDSTPFCRPAGSTPW